MASKLYVGNLAYSVTNDDLEALFSQAGAVESVAVITDKFSGQSKGFGFVEMTDSTELKGRNIKVNEARPREAGGGGGNRGGGGGGGNRSGGGGGGGNRGGSRW